MYEFNKIKKDSKLYVVTIIKNTCMVDRVIMFSVYLN